ncbi:MAG: prepilin-type N-terminal cleavage/methylation domain-containing protein [Proteobacteria bacterium]|nr:prepilin-type N-terminal cleavage/methylation domain-containing protein [Pseudomonadota bacterium]
MRRGFTLVELMAAVLISSIVIIAGYSLMTGSTGTFKDQDDRRFLESNLRNAELLLQRDISRIGYHVPFDSQASTEPWYMGSGRLRAFRYHTGTATNGFAAFSFVADLTDYDGFEILSPSGAERCLLTELRLPLAAVDLQNIEIEDPVERQASLGEFRTAFAKNFQFARAGYIESATNKGIVVPFASNARILDNDNGSCTYGFKFLENYDSRIPGELGFSSANVFEHDLISPIVVITYYVDSDHNLQRCYNRNMENPTIASVQTCEVIIGNVDYFEIYPISFNITGTVSGSNLTSSVINTSTSVYASHREAVIATPGSQKDKIDALWSSSKLRIEHLRGIYFRLGAHGYRRSIIAGFGEQASNQVSYVDGFPAAHIQGTSVLKNAARITQNSANSTVLTW